MAIESEIIAQVDWSGGQINSSASRRDDLPVVRSGALAAQNFRTEAQGTALSRPGRDAVYQPARRTELARMSAANTYHVHFYPGEIVITDEAGDVAASNTSAAYLWTNATVSKISFSVGLFACVICFPGMQPQLLQWAPDTATWSFSAFAWAVVSGNNQEPFYRFNALGAAMSWDTTTTNYATVGASITLTCSESYFTAAMATDGAVLSILGGQVRITAVSSATVATATVLSRLPDTVVFAGVDPTAFAVGDVAEATNSGLKIEIINVGTTTVTGPLMSGRVMSTVNNSVADTLSSPQASSATSGFSKYTAGATSTVQWQEEFMGPINGWPAAVSFGNNRFIFSQFPQRQEAILWLATGAVNNGYIDSAAATTDQSAGASATSAILEFVTGRPKVLNVIDTGDEFVFTDRGVYFIPLAVSSTALTPTTVSFRQITNDGCSAVKPVPILQAVVYCNAAGNRISAVRATGSFTLPYSSDDLTDVHSDLFNAPICIAVSGGDEEPERLVYVVNSDGSVVVGKFSRENGVTGWHPETGVGATMWVMTEPQKVWFNVLYTGGVVMELENEADYLDSTLFFNNPPANMVVGGKGPFWWLAGGTVTLAENGVDLGDRSIDSNGFIVEIQGDVLTDAAMIGGAAIPKTYTPRISQSPPGQSRGQRMKRRKIKRAMLTLESNCEFDWGSKRIAAYDFGDDQSQAPAFQERSILERPAGRSYAPSISLTSERYGQIRLKDFSAEVTI